MTKKLIVLLVGLLFLNGCVETVVIGSVVAGAIVLSDGSVLDLSSDSKIKTATKKSFKNDEECEEFKNVNVIVYNSKVMLTGHVTNATYKRKAFEKAKSIKSDIEVIDEIMIFDPNYKPGSLSDSFISSQVSLKMKTTSGIISSNYEYDVVDGIIFIIGSAQNKNELNKVTDTISRVRGIRKVVSYIVIVKK